MMLYRWLGFFIGLEFSLPMQNIELIPAYKMHVQFFQKKKKHLSEHGYMLLMVE
jgi:hypothetical protein